MAPHRSNGRGSLIVKRKFRGVPMIRRATGTRDPKVVEQVELMLQALYSQGRLDLLEAVARGRLTLLQVLAQWRLGRELTLPPADVLPSLADSWRAWVERLPAGEHRRKIGLAERALRIPAGATLADLPYLVTTYRTRAADRPRSVNLVRAYARAFLRDTVGTSHTLYLAVKDVRPLQTGERVKGTPHPMPYILELCTQMGAQAGGMAWTMAASGMGNKEYWHDGFDATPERVNVHGRKTDRRANRTRDREVPRWCEEPLVAPTMSEKAFRKALKEASDGVVGIYDLRRSFARWCEEAGIIDTNRDAYLGHGPRTMTQLYTWGQLPGQLATDATKLRVYRASVTDVIAAGS